MVRSRSACGLGMAASPIASGRSPLKARTAGAVGELRGPGRSIPATASRRTRSEAQEAGEARKWGVRRKASVDRYGSHAAIAGEPKAGPPPSKDEMNTLRAIVFEGGGFRTIQQCVRHWERLETWGRSQNIQVILLTTDVLIKYVLDLSDRGCGPTVIPSVHGAVKWICKLMAGLPRSRGCPRDGCAEEGLRRSRERDTGGRVDSARTIVASLERFVVARWKPGEITFFAWPNPTLRSHKVCVRSLAVQRVLERWRFSKLVSKFSVW